MDSYRDAEPPGEDDEGSGRAGTVSVTRWHVGSELFDIESRFRVVDYLGQGGKLLAVGGPHPDFPSVCSLRRRLWRVRRARPAKLCHQEVPRRLPLAHYRQAHSARGAAAGEPEPRECMFFMLGCAAADLTRAPQVIKLLTVQVPDDVSAFTDLYLVFERMDCDLTSVIKSSTAISEVHAQVSHAD